MAVHKFMFWISSRGIQTYRIKKNNSYELIRYQGNAFFTDSDVRKFFASEWFNDVASIAEDDSIDFCFLSESPVEFPDFKYEMETKSSWNKSDIMKFCEKFVNVNNYRVITDIRNKEKSFVCQTGNIYNKEQMAEVYLKCIPEFSLDTAEISDATSEEEGSILYRYYRDILNMRR